MSIGTHTSHCCKEHGCKYGNADCPVEFYNYAQEFPCEYCSEEIGNYFAQNILRDYYITLQVMEEFFNEGKKVQHKVLGIQASNSEHDCLVYYNSKDGVKLERVELEKFNTYYKKHRFKGIVK